MRRIQPELTDELLKHFGDPTKVGSTEPFPVATFRELVEHTAKLAYKNKDHLIFYRGQSTDYKIKRVTLHFIQAFIAVIICQFANSQIALIF